MVPLCVVVDPWTEVYDPISNQALLQVGLLPRCGVLCWGAA